MFLFKDSLDNLGTEFFRGYLIEISYYSINIKFQQKLIGTTIFDEQHL